MFEYLKGRGRPVREETLCAALALAPDAPVLRDLRRKGDCRSCPPAASRRQLVMVRLADGIETPDDGKDHRHAKAECRTSAAAGQASLKEVCYFAVSANRSWTGLRRRASQYYTREVCQSPYTPPSARDYGRRHRVVGRAAAARDALVVCRLTAANRRRRCFTV